MKRDKRADGHDSSGDNTKTKNLESSPQEQLVEGIDYVMEGGLLVFTRDYHLRRGYCCTSGCRHCPYGNAPK